ncbi:hypothetical protein DevBK_07715 [Devosia sp. BK]|uniref:hypothetical protein n=1 Tax=Devosia sp. BK TaxID=2871706 RepID=UPI00293A72B0|nr:hypothetical protein [Devosia sp. BK]MDV3251210.1 hypothetical protein [Devosia sp. BK]
MRPALALCIIMAAIVPATAAEIIDTQATDGTCERLVIADENLTAQCGTGLAVLTYDDGRVAVSAGTGGQDFFGLGEPERMLLLIGPGKPWMDFNISSVVISAAAETEDPVLADVSGACTHVDATPGFLVSCEAKDGDGRTYALTYRTDGGQIHSF